MTDQQKAIIAQCEGLGKTLVEKNRAYGSSAFIAPPFAPQCDEGTAILVRMGDKVERLRALLTHSVNDNDESTTDTVRDLAGYCILWLVWNAERGAGSTEGTSGSTEATASEIKEFDHFLD